MRQLHGKASSIWASTLSQPLHPSPHSLNPHWEVEGETREAGEDEEEGSNRTGQRLHWHPWESTDPFSGNYQHQCREAVSRRGAGARGCGRVLEGGVGRDGGAQSKIEIMAEQSSQEVVMRVREVVRWRAMWVYFQLWQRMRMRLTFWASAWWFCTAVPFTSFLVSGWVITRE